MRNDWEDPKTGGDIAGLRNQVRLVMVAAEAGDLKDVRSQLAALLDDLRSPTVRFQWASQAELAEMAEATRRGVAAYAAENPAMVD